MYPGPNHMRDRHGNNPDLRPDQRMPLNLESRRDLRRDSHNRERQRQEARAQREKGLFPQPTAVVPEPSKTAMFTLVRRPQSDNALSKILGSFDSFAGSDQNLELMGVDQQPGTPAPVTNHHDAPQHHPTDNRSHRHTNFVPARSHSSNFRAPDKLPAKQPLVPSSTSNESKPAFPKSKPTLMIDDAKLTMIFDEMADLTSPMSALRETPKHDGQTAFKFPTPSKNYVRSGKSATKQTPADTIQNYHCDLSDDSDVEPNSSGLNGNNAHPNGKVRLSSTTSQNSDDSSNSEDSSCSDSEDSSSNSSEEEKSTHPEPSRMPPSPVTTDPIAMSWSLEKIFQPNGNSAKDDAGRDQEMMPKPYDGQYDSLSRSPHQTELAPPIITKEPVRRMRRLTETTSDESALDSSVNSTKRRMMTDKITNEYMSNFPKPLCLSESEMESDTMSVTKHKVPIIPQPMYKETPTKNSKSENLPRKSTSKSSKESSSRKSHSIKEKVSRKDVKSRETVPTDFDTDSDDGKVAVKCTQKNKTPVKSSSSSRRSRKLEDTSKTERRSSRHSKPIEMSPPAVQESRQSKPIEMSPPPVQESKHSSKSSENVQKQSYSRSPSKRSHRHTDNKTEMEKNSKKSVHEDKPSKQHKRSVSPKYCYSVNQRIKVPKLDVLYCEDPSAVLFIPLELVKKITSDKSSPTRVHGDQEVEMRTSPSNEDAKKLRAICSIYKGSKKRPSSQEPERTRKNSKLKESHPVKHEVSKPDQRKEKSTSRTSTPIPESTHRHSSSRHRASKSTESAKDKEKEHVQSKEEKKRRRRMSEEVEIPKKRNKIESAAETSHELAEHKVRTDKKDSYRSYVKDASSPVPRPSSRMKESLRAPTCTTNHNEDLHEFNNVERNSDDDACFRTPQQVQNYGCKEQNAKRNKVDERQSTVKTVPSPAATTSHHPHDLVLDHTVPPTPSYYFSYLERRIPDVATDHATYLVKAKELKHLADKESNRTLQVMIYLESGLYFILTGESMELESGNTTSAFSMYNDTLKFIRHVSSIIIRKDNFKEGPSHLNTRLAVLSLRCQSLLYLKLYTLHAGEANEVQKDLVEYFKSAPKLTTVPATWNQGMCGTAPATTAIGGRLANSPSSLSPTPSPAGSVGSEGSQSSSGYGTEGASQRAVAGHLVPKHTFMTLQRHLSIANYLVAAHHHWKESDTYIMEKTTMDFFIDMDHERGPLTLHATPSELVLYVQKSLDKLKLQLSIGVPSRADSSVA